MAERHNRDCEARRSTTNVGAFSDPTFEPLASRKLPFSGRYQAAHPPETGKWKNPNVERFHAIHNNRYQTQLSLFLKPRQPCWRECEVSGLRPLISALPTRKPRVRPRLIRR